MRRAGEHVEQCAFFRRVEAVCAEQFQIAGERGGIAGDVDQIFRRTVAQGGNGFRQAAHARRVDDGDCCFYFGQASPKLSWLKEKLLDVTYRVPVGGFWQVNPPVAERLLQTVKSWCEALPAKGHLLDIYGGAGTFTMQLGPMFSHRSLVESDVPAVNAADFALQEAGLITELWKGPAEEFLSAKDGPLANIDLDQTVAVIDPPRMGCLPKAISALRDCPPKYLIYVSCNPATLARDLKLLCADGLYTPEKCALFDMFPRTAHFESVCLLYH